MGTLNALRQGLRAVGRIINELRNNRNLAVFLLAHMKYADGLGTLFALGGLYASAVFGMSIAEVIQFGIALNVAAGAGAFGFAWLDVNRRDSPPIDRLDDWLGSRCTILLAITGLVTAAITAVSAESIVWLWIAGIGIGVFVGPVQAASRSLMAKLTPVERRTECFGLFTMSGKATAFLGPALVALNPGNRQPALGG